VLKGASVHRYLTFALLRDASSPVVRRRLIDLCVGLLVRAPEFEPSFRSGFVCVDRLECRLSLSLTK
jgi:hypothetical protein